MKAVLNRMRADRGLKGNELEEVARLREEIMFDFSMIKYALPHLEICTIVASLPRVPRIFSKRPPSRKTTKMWTTSMKTLARSMRAVWKPFLLSSPSRPNRRKTDPFPWRQAIQRNFQSSK